MSHLIVRGIVGESVAQLTKDERDIYTAYELINAQILFPSPSQTGLSPGTSPAISFTMRGGTVLIDGCKASVSYSGVPRLKTGTEVIVLILRKDEQLWPLRNMFEVRGSQVVRSSTR